MKILNIKDTVYYARIIPNTGVYEVCELMIRTVTDTYFAGIDKRDKHTYLFGYSALNDIIFDDRKMALNKVKQAENNKIDISDEIFYEEY